MSAWTTLRAWIQAARLPSQSYIALGLLLGQALAWRASGAWDWGVFALVQLYGLLDQLFIVWANDLADHESDRLNTTFTPFSGGSRVLVSGALLPADLRRAALVAATGALATSVGVGVGWGRWGMVPLVLLGLALLHAYSFPPLRLSYRGGGELAQTAGVGLVLPLIGFYAQTGDLAAFPWSALAALLPLQLTCAMCTAQPDEPSDRASHKRTTAVWMGPGTARLAIVLINYVALGVAPLTAILPANDPRAFYALVLPLVANTAALVTARAARPGTRAMLAFVFFGLLTTLSWMGTMIYLLLSSPPATG